jgi:ribosome biogenesis GTPase
VGIDVHWISSPTGEGIAALRGRLEGKVSVMLGQSGVGKSTLVNALDPTALQLTGATREVDSRGRHTTTSSRLIPMTGGGALVDTPGIRELAPDVTDLHAAAKAYPELQPYLGRCRFQDCAHLGESGCALEEAAIELPEVRRGLDRLRRLIESQQD